MRNRKHQEVKKIEQEFKRLLGKLHIREALPGGSDKLINELQMIREATNQAQRQLNIADDALFHPVLVFGQHFGGQANAGKWGAPVI